MIGVVLVTFLAIEPARLGASLWISHWADVDHSAHNRTNATHTFTGGDGMPTPFAAGGTFGDDGLFGFSNSSSSSGTAPQVMMAVKSSYYYIAIYGAISGGQAALTLVNRLIVAFTSVRAGKVLHSEMLTALLRAPM